MLVLLTITIKPGLEPEGQSASFYVYQSLPANSKDLSPSKVVFSEQVTVGIPTASLDAVKNNTVLKVLPKKRFQIAGVQEAFSLDVYLVDHF